MSTSHVQSPVGGSSPQFGSARPTLGWRQRCLQPGRSCGLDHRRRHRRVRGIDRVQARLHRRGLQRPGHPVAVPAPDARVAGASGGSPDRGVVLRSCCLCHLRVGANAGRVRRSASVEPRYRNRCGLLGDHAGTVVGTAPYRPRARLRQRRCRLQTDPALRVPVRCTLGGHQPGAHHLRAHHLRAHHLRARDPGAAPGPPAETANRRASGRAWSLVFSTNELDTRRSVGPRRSVGGGQGPESDPQDQHLVRVRQVEIEQFRSSPQPISQRVRMHRQA